MPDSGKVAGRRGDRRSPSKDSDRQGLELPGQDVSFGWWVIRYCEGGPSENQPGAQPLCVSGSHKNRGSPSP